ncbi:MAG: MFS transporter, partial [Gammaproteobacteria bacterium]|nr:MFS transporter [Gammaproteobacteria bacterium]
MATSGMVDSWSFIWVQGCQTCARSRARSPAFEYGLMPRILARSRRWRGCAVYHRSKGSSKGFGRRGRRIMNQQNVGREAPKYYPWAVAVMGMLALFLSNGMTATGITIFDPSLLDEFGWSRGDFKFRDFLNFALTATISPFVGILIDRVNPRYLLMTGCGLLTLGYVGYSMIANGGPVPAIEAIAVVTALGLAGVIVVA